MMKMLGRLGLMMLAWLPLPWLLVAWEAWDGEGFGSVPVMVLTVVAVLVTMLALWMLFLLLREGRVNTMHLDVVDASPYRWPKGVAGLYAAPYITLVVAGALGDLLTGSPVFGPLDPIIGVIALVLSIMVMAACANLVDFANLNPMVMLFGYSPWEITGTFHGIGSSSVNRLSVTLMTRGNPAVGDHIRTGDDLPAGRTGDRVRYAIG